jgi:ketosteroid isomerase-like protein
LPGGILRGREAIAADFQTLFKSGLRVSGLTTTDCQSDGHIGYAAQIEHSNRGDTNTLLVFRQDKDGNWQICAEAVIGNG